MNTHQRDITNYQRIAKLLSKTHIRRLMKPDCLSLLPELNLRSEQRILDIGCNNGRLLFTLATFLDDCELHGLDIAEEQIRNNQKRNRYKNLQFHCAPAENLPFANNWFDLITCSNAMSHFPQRVRALDEMHRVLKPSGELYILEGLRDSAWKQKFEKILRQSRFIRPEKKHLPRTAVFSKSYFIHFIK